MNARDAARGSASRAGWWRDRGAWTAEHPARGGSGDAGDAGKERSPMTDDAARPEFTTALDHDGGEARLRVAGEVDMLTAPDFSAALSEALETAPALTIDLVEVA